MPQATGSTSDTVPLQAEERIYRKVTLRIVPFLFLCYLAAYLDRVNVAFAKLQMLDELKFSEQVYALGAGVFFIGYVLVEVPSTRLAGLTHSNAASLYLFAAMLVVSGVLVLAVPGRLVNK